MDEVIEFISCPYCNEQYVAKLFEVVTEMKCPKCRLHFFAEVTITRTAQVTTRKQTIEDMEARYEG
jgi:phage FluMu protein Com